MQDQETIVQATTRIVERTVVLVAGVSITLALMFVAGNYQGFADGTQLQILTVLQVLSGALSIAAAVLVVLQVWAGIEAGSLRRILRAVLSVIVVALALSLAIGSTSLLVLFQPR